MAIAPTTTRMLIDWWWWWWWWWWSWSWLWIYIYTYMYTYKSSWNHMKFNQCIHSQWCFIYHTDIQKLWPIDHLSVAYSSTADVLTLLSYVDGIFSSWLQTDDRWFSLRGDCAAASMAHHMIDWPSNWFKYLPRYSHTHTPSKQLTNNNGHYIISPYSSPFPVIICFVHSIGFYRIWS